MPTRPNRLGKAGIDCARERKKRSAVDGCEITCYNESMEKKIPSIATLVRDGYLLPEEANYPDQVYHAAMDWQNDYEDHLMDALMNDPETYNDDR